MNKKMEPNLHKKKRILKWLSITLMFSILILAINQLFIKDLDAMQETITSSEIYPGLNLKTTKQEAEIYTLFVSQPITADEEIDEQIDQWIMDERNIFRQEVEAAAEVLKEHELNAHLNIQTTTTKLADKLYNLDLESYQIAGGASGSTKAKPIIVDLTDHEILELSDIFTLNEENISQIKDIVSEEVQQNKDLKDYVFEDLLAEVMENDQEWKVSIHPDTVIFSFDQYEVAAGAAGLIKIAIPMEKLVFQMNPHFVEKMNIEVPEEEEVEGVKEEIEEEVELVEEIEESEAESKPQVDGKYIALTFDDGPHAEVTTRILKTLAEHGIKATFYMLGNQVDYYPSLAEQVLAEGHELGNHTMSHKDLTRLGADQVREEIQNTSNKIQSATGSSPRSLRPPYGAFNGTVKDIAAELDLPIAMWSVDSLDWKSRNVAAINQEVMSTVHPGAIVLLHDIHATTADALPSLLDNLEKEGYEFVTVSQLLELGAQSGIGPHHQINIQ